MIEQINNACNFTDLFSLIIRSRLESKNFNHQKIEFMLLINHLISYLMITYFYLKRQYLIWQFGSNVKNWLLLRNKKMRIKKIPTAPQMLCFKNAAGISCNSCKLLIFSATFYKVNILRYSRRTLNSSRCRWKIRIALIKKKLN